MEPEALELGRYIRLVKSRILVVEDEDSDEGGDDR
jgi:hypothetical protein